jgi:hypothetical protein
MYNLIMAIIEVEHVVASYLTSLIIYNIVVFGLYVFTLYFAID